MNVGDTMHWKWNCGIPCSEYGSVPCVYKVYLPGNVKWKYEILCSVKWKCGIPCSEYGTTQIQWIWKFGIPSTTCGVCIA
jgi:hypothetical protein